MKKSTKIAIIGFIVLIIAVIPLYYYTRPDSSQPTGLQIKGKVGNPANLTYTQLEAYPAITLQVNINGHQGGNGVYNYTGITLKELLTGAQVSSNATSVYIQASDGYGTTLTMQEAQKNTVFIAYKKDGATLSPLSEGGEGPYRLVIIDDEYSQRWVRGVAAIEVS